MRDASNYKLKSSQRGGGRGEIERKKDRERGGRERREMRKERKEENEGG